VAGLIVRKVQKLKDLTLTDLEATMTKGTSHNEWVVKDYMVLGMFAHPPYIAGDRYVKLQDLLNLSRPTDIQLQRWLDLSVFPRAERAHRPLRNLS
jgi:hypothetical protein